MARTNGKTARNGSRPKKTVDDLIALRAKRLDSYVPQDKLAYVITTAGLVPGDDGEPVDWERFDWNEAQLHVAKEALDRGFAMLIEDVPVEVSAWVAAEIAQKLEPAVCMRHVPKCNLLLVWATDPTYSTMDAGGALGDPGESREGGLVNNECTCCEQK